MAASNFASISLVQPRDSGDDPNWKPLGTGLYHTLGGSTACSTKCGVQGDVWIRRGDTFRPHIWAAAGIDDSDTGVLESQVLRRGMKVPANKAVQSDKPPLFQIPFLTRRFPREHRWRDLQRFTASLHTSPNNRPKTSEECGQMIEQTAGGRCILCHLAGPSI